jgi:hypothetical protein
LSAAGVLADFAEHLQENLLHQIWRILLTDHADNEPQDLVLELFVQLLLGLAIPLPSAFHDANDRLSPP